MPKKFCLESISTISCPLKHLIKINELEYFSLKILRNA